MSLMAKKCYTKINWIKAHVWYVWFTSAWPNFMVTSNFAGETWILLINLHISLITKRFFWSFDRHSNKTVTHSELLQDINNFSKTIVDDIRKSHEFSIKIVRVITIVVSNPVNFLVNARLWRQSIASGFSMPSRFAAVLLLSPPSDIPYTLTEITDHEVHKIFESFYH